MKKKLTDKGKLTDLNFYTYKIFWIVLIVSGTLGTMV